MILIISTQTNNCNDNITTDYIIAADEQEERKWVEQKEEYINRWNYNTPGAVSIRYIEFNRWTDESIKNAYLSDFSCLTIGDFAKIFLLLSK
jgi:hypothetical protein